MHYILIIGIPDDEHPFPEIGCGRLEILIMPIGIGGDGKLVISIQSIDVLRKIKP